MFPSPRFAALASGLAAALTPLAAQRAAPIPAVFVAGTGPETIVLVSGMVGGVAGFRRLTTLLVARGQQVIVIDPYYLSIDSADVSFAALARRVDAVLAERGVTAARVVGHSQGAGVAVRLAAMSPQRVAELYLLDAGALPANRGAVLSASLRLAPLIARVPGGRDFIRRRFVRGLRQSSGGQEWLDADTQRAYTEPMLGSIGRVVDMARRLARAEEPESVSAVVSRVHVPVTVLLGDAPHMARSTPEEITALAPLASLLRVERLPGVGHFPHEEVPDEVARFVLAAQVASAGRPVERAR